MTGLALIGKFDLILLRYAFCVCCFFVLLLITVAVDRTDRILPATNFPFRIFRLRSAHNHHHQLHHHHDHHTINRRQRSPVTMLPPSSGGGAAHNDSNANATEIKVKVAYNGEIMITYIQEAVSLDQLCREIRAICRFLGDQVHALPPKTPHSPPSQSPTSHNRLRLICSCSFICVPLSFALILISSLFVFTLQLFTMKWIDEDNDPCTISSQDELNEAIRLYEVNRDTELVIHGE